MPRQIEESVLIDNMRTENDVTMNSKSEWRSTTIPRVRVEMGNRLSNPEADSKPRGL